MFPLDPSVQRKHLSTQFEFGFTGENRSYEKLRALPGLSPAPERLAGFIFALLSFFRTVRIVAGKLTKRRCDRVVSDFMDGSLQADDPAPLPVSARRAEGRDQLSAFRIALRHVLGVPWRSIWSHE